MPGDKKLKIQARKLSRKLKISHPPCLNDMPLGALVNQPSDVLYPSSISSGMPLSPSYTYPVEVQPAGEMGKGVFATRDIDKGDLLCFYDGICCFNSSYADIVSGKCGYKQSSSDGSSIAGFQTELRPGGCGQLINDASNDLSSYGNEEYQSKINTMALNIHGTAVCGMFATRHICRGEQLFYSYGKDYWKEKLSGLMDFRDEAIKNLPGINMGLEKDDYIQRLYFCSHL